MKITINSDPADIILDTEKNVGDVLAGLESWLSGSGCRISGLSINGETATSSSLDEAFVRDLQGIETFEIRSHDPAP
jgi:hypothetical protein